MKKSKATLRELYGNFTNVPIWEISEEIFQMFARIKLSDFGKALEKS